MNSFRAIKGRGLVLATSIFLSVNGAAFTASSRAQEPIKLSPKPPIVVSEETIRELRNNVQTAEQKLKAAREALDAALKQKLELMSEDSNSTADRKLEPYVQRILAHRLIAAMDVSVRGDQVATSGDYALGKIWNLHTGELLATLDNTPNQNANFFKYTPDGKWLLAGSIGELLVLSTKGYQLSRKLQSKVGFIHNVTISDDGERMLLYGWSGRVERWSLKTWALVEAFDTQMHFVRSAVFTRDGHGAIACGGFYNNEPSTLDHTVSAWDWEAPKEKYRFAATPKTSTDHVLELPDGDLLTYGGAQSFSIWDTRKLVSNLTFRPQIEIPKVIFTADMSYAIMASGTKNEVLCVSPKSGNVQHRFSMQVGSPEKLAITPDQRHLVVGTSSGWVEVLSLPNGVVPEAFRDQPARRAPRDVIPKTPEIPPSRILDGPTDIVSAVAFIPGTNQMLSGGADRALRLWDTTTGTIQRQFEFEPGEPINGLALSADGQLAIACGDGDRGRLLVWNLETWKPERNLEGHIGPVHGVSFTRDGRILSSGSDKTVRIWNPQAEKATTVIERLRFPGEKVVMAPDGDTIATLCRDVVTLCNPKTGQTGNNVSASGHVLTYQPGFDHQLLMAHGTNLHVSRTPNMAIGGVFDYPLKSPQCGTFTPDGKMIVATQEGDPNPVVFDYESRKQVFRLTGAQGEMTDLAVSRSGLVAGACKDRRIYLWAIPK